MEIWTAVEILIVINVLMKIIATSIGVSIVLCALDAMEAHKRS